MNVVLSFLLTHPVWDVTEMLQQKNTAIEFLLTHPVWDVTQTLALPMHPIQISTHTSRVGCDNSNLDENRQRGKFLLTHPVWDVTGCIAIFP